MPDLSFVNLAACLAAAFAARLLLGLAPRLQLPGPVLEILVGIVLGPACLGWIHVDQTVSVVALLGLSFSLFLAGLEIDLVGLRGGLLGTSAAGLALSAVLAVAVAVAIASSGLVTGGSGVGLIAVTLCATSLGLVVSVAKQGGFERTALGQLVIAGSTVGDFGAIVALSLLFSRDSRSSSSRFILLVAFVVLCATLWAVLRAGTRQMRIADLIARLADTSAQIRVRGVMVLVVGAAVLAERTGLETILGCFVVGALVRAIDRDGMARHPTFRVKLDALGFGFLVPVFYVTAGLRFDVHSLLRERQTLALVPVFTTALLIVRGVPAALYRHHVSGHREILVAALLQATSLPFIVTATMIGAETGALTPAVAAAFVGAGLVSAILFPVAALTLVRRNDATMPNTAVA